MIMQSCEPNFLGICLWHWVNLWLCKDALSKWCKIATCAFVREMMCVWTWEKEWETEKERVRERKRKKERERVRKEWKIKWEREGKKDLDLELK